MECTMNTAISRTIWHDLSAWALETEALRTIIVPEMGAKIASLFDKRSRREWLIGPGDRPFRVVPYGATFVDQDMSGWDEMFPTILACDYPGPGDRQGVFLPDHGEAWTLPWSIDEASDRRLTLRVEGRALPYHLTRTAEYSAADTLQFQYQLINRGADVMPYMWAAHPQFDCGDEAEMMLPPHITTVCNAIGEAWGWGVPETRFDWPLATALDGTQVHIDRIGPPSLKGARKFFVPPEMRAGWAALICHPSEDWLRMDWDAERIPYVGLWADEGAFNPASVAALEPMTGYYDSLITAWDKQRVSMIEPGETHTWTLTVRVGTASPPGPLS
jgi:galactose mutarotase-like enzyme